MAEAPVTAAGLLGLLRLEGEQDGSRLIVHAQNPAGNYYWTKAVGGFTAGQVRAALLIDRALDIAAASVRPAPNPNALLGALTALLEETEGMVTLERRGLGLARYQALEAYEAATGRKFVPRAEARA